MCFNNITFIHLFRSVGVEVDKINLNIVIEKLAGKSLEEIMATGNSKLADSMVLVDLMATVNCKLDDKLTEEHMVSDISKMDNKSLEEPTATDNSKHADKSVEDLIANDIAKLVDNSIEENIDSCITKLTNKSPEESLDIVSSKHVDKCTENPGATPEEHDDDAVGELFPSDSSKMPSIPSGR